ncbi:hypothetical protein GC173_11550 [bacterium]|nr:hypothetical protein [bacterium]
MSQYLPFALFFLTTVVGIIGFFVKQLIAEVHAARIASEQQGRSMTLVLERTEVLIKGFDRIQGRMLQLERDNAAMLSNVASNDERSLNHEARITRVEERIGHIEQRVSRFESHNP